MKIGVISDIHDNIWKLEAVLIELKGVDMVLCLGDMCSPFTLKQIADAFPGPVHIVFGNNDGDKWLLTQNAIKAGNVTLHDGIVELEVGADGSRVSTSRSSGVGWPREDGSRRDSTATITSASLSGLCATWLVNPGEVMGRFGHTTYAIYDTETDQADIFEVG